MVHAFSVIGHLIQLSRCIGKTSREALSKKIAIKNSISEAQHPFPNPRNFKPSKFTSFPEKTRKERYAFMGHSPNKPKPKSKARTGVSMGSKVYPPKKHMRKLPHVAQNEDVSPEVYNFEELLAALTGRRNASYKN